MDVALSATSALGDQQALAVLGEVADLLVGIDVGNHGAYRHADGDVLAALAGHLPTHAVFAAHGAEHALMAEIDKGVEAFIGKQPDAAAVGTVTAVGTAKGDEFLAAEADAAVAAVAGLDSYGGFVDELHVWGRE